MTFKELKIGSNFHWEGDHPASKPGDYRKISTEHATELRTHKVVHVPSDADVKPTKA